MIIKNIYKGSNGLNNAVLDLKNNVESNIGKYREVLTTEFVRLNEPNMFRDMGDSIKDVKAQTDYKKGEVIGENEYFAYVYYGVKNEDGSWKIHPGGRKGKARNDERPVFIYTYEENQDYLEGVLVDAINKSLEQ